MSRTSHETPMDFEFQNGTGPLDARSPFAQLSQNQQRYNQASSPLRKESFNGYNSPTRSILAHNSTPSPSKPLAVPPSSAFNGLFTTPRKSRQEFDDSSAGETPRSPENRDDSDATPDMKRPRAAPMRQDFSTRPTSSEGQIRRSSVKDRPKETSKDNNFMLRLKNKLYSPGRGEVPRVERSHNSDRVVEKRRKREVDRRVARRRRHSMTDSEADAERQGSSPRKAGQQHNAPESNAAKPHWISSLFTFIAQHPTVPHVLSFYAQLIFNLFLLCGCAYLFYCFWSAVQGDVDKRSHEAMAGIMAEMAACAEQYTVNKCDRTTRVPAMETVCENWAKCMKQDPALVGRAKISAHTFAEIFNSFVEPISYKAMAFTFILVFGCFATSNFAFGFFRDRTAAAAAAYQPYYNPQSPPPPPTPQRSFSGQDGAFYGPSTPWHAPPVAYEPQPSAGYGHIEGRSSPVRRLAYH